MIVQGVTRIFANVRFGSVLERAPSFLGNVFIISILDTRSGVAFAFASDEAKQSATSENSFPKQSRLEKRSAYVCVYILT